MNTQTATVTEIDYQASVDFDARREQVAAELAADAADGDTGW